jgi:plasmid stabilization system protein ParE
MAFKIVWSPIARLDLKDIVTFVAEDCPQIAEKFGLKIFDYAERAS